MAAIPSDCLKWSSV